MICSPMVLWRAGVRSCLIVAAALAGCVGPPGAPEPGQITVLIGSWPSNVDPRFAPDAWSEKISRLVFAPLLDRAGDGSIVPSIGEQFWFESPLDLRVLVREDAAFADGSPVLADDVVATYQAIADPALGSVRRLSLSPVVAVEVVSSHVVRFLLREPHAPILQVLATIGIAPRSALEAAARWQHMPLTGSGPYSFETIERDRHLILRANDSWYQGRPPVERLKFRVVPDSTVRALEMLRGAADLTQNDLPPHVVDRLRADPNLRVEQSPSTLVKYLVFNTRRAPFDDARVRRAIASAIDVEAIVAHKLRGQGRASDSFLVRGSWAHAGHGGAWSYDPGRAQELLDEAGLRPDAQGRRLRVEYRTSQDETSVAVAMVMRRQLLAVGIELEVRSTEWGVFFADIKHGDFDAYTLTGVGLNDPDWFSFVLESRAVPPDGANRGRFASPALDALLERGRRTIEVDERAAIYSDVQRIVAEELPIVPLWHPDNVVVLRRGLQGFELRPDGLMDSLRSARWEAR